MKKTIFTLTILLLFNSNAVASSEKLSLEQILSAQQVILDPVTEDGAPLVGFANFHDLAAEKVCEILKKKLVSKSLKTITLNDGDVYWRGSAVSIDRVTYTGDAVEVQEVTKIICGE